VNFKLLNRRIFKIIGRVKVKIKEKEQEKKHRYGSVKLFTFEKITH
jgi:hypothetical protein